MKKRMQSIKVVLGLPILYLLIGTLINIIYIYSYMFINKLSINEFYKIKVICNNKYSNIISSIIDFIFLLVLVRLFSKSDSGRNLIKSFNFSFKKLKLKDLINSILLGIGLTILGMIITGTLSIFISSYTKVSYEISQSYSNIVGILLSVTFIPIFEELFFRGIIFGYLRKNYNLTISIVVQALVFSILHMNLIQSVYTFILGIFLALIYVETKTILAPIIVHMTYNLFGSVGWHFLFELCKQASIIYFLLGLGALLFSTFHLIKNLKYKQG